MRRKVRRARKKWFYIEKTSSRKKKFSAKKDSRRQSRFNWETVYARHGTYYILGKGNHSITKEKRGN